MKITQRAAAIKRWLPWILKLAVSIALIGYLLTKVGLQGAWSRTLAIPPLLIIAATALLAVQTLVWALRWSLVVHGMGRRLPIRDSIPISFVGMFLSQFLPASIGADAVRMWQSQRAGLPISIAVNSVLIERAGTLLAVCLLAAVTSQYWVGLLGSRFAAWVFPIVALAGICGIALLISVAGLPRRWFEGHRALRGMVYLSEDARKIFLRTRNVLPLTALAVMGQTLLAVAVYALASGLGIGLTLLQCFLLMPPVVVISSLPISVAGWGVRELAMITALGFMGVDADVALLLSVILAALGVLISLPGGLLLFLHRTPRAGQELQPKQPGER